MTGLIFWLVAAPLLASALILVLPKLGAQVYRTVALLGAVVSLVLALVAWEGFQPGAQGFQFVSNLHWFTFPNLWMGHDLAVALSFGVDGLSLPLATLAIVVTLLAMLTVKPHVERAREYFFWLSLVSAGLYGVFTALDIFTFLLALELTLFSTFFLIYLFGGPGRRQAAFKFLIYRGTATVFLLIALIGIAYEAAGGFGASVPATGAVPGFNIPVLLAVLHSPAAAAGFPVAVKSALFLVLLLAVFIEEAFVPFHTWLPTTHEQADTPTNMIIGGVLTKTGAYVLLRFGVGLLPAQVQHWGFLIAIFGVINIVYGALAAWAQQDWRRLIAFGSISHMGLVLLGIAAFNSAGLQGAMFMLVSSGLLTAMLFYLTGAMADRTRTNDLERLGGLSKQMPMLSGFLLLAALGSLGLPLTSGFISEIQSFIGGFGTYPAVSFVGALGLILSAVYLLYAIQRTTFGPIATEYSSLTDARPIEYVPIVVLTALVLLVGVYPAVLGNLFGPSVHALLGIGG